MRTSKTCSHGCQHIRTAASTNCCPITGGPPTPDPKYKNACLRKRQRVFTGTLQLLSSLTLRTQHNVCSLTSARRSHHTLFSLLFHIIFSISKIYFSKNI